MHLNVCNPNGLHSGLQAILGSCYQKNELSD